MQIKLKSKNLDLTEALKEYTERKLSRIQKYFDQILSAEVMLSTQRNLHIVDVTIHVDGVVLRGEEKTDNMYSSIDKVIDKLERQVLKLKERRQDHHHVKDKKEESLETPKSSIPVVFKRQYVFPQTVEEAFQEMEASKKDLHLFHNAETETLNLLLRDKNGKFTVIEPILRK
jgi:putative sigma-54 modulation protein